MKATTLLRKIADYEIKAEASGKRVGDVLHLDLDLYPRAEWVNIDAHISDRAYRTSATYDHDTESGYAVDSVEIFWCAVCDRTTPINDELKKGLAEWIAEWLAEDWADGGDCAKCDTMPAHLFAACDRRIGSGLASR